MSGTGHVSIQGCTDCLLPTSLPGFEGLWLVQFACFVEETSYHLHLERVKTLDRKIWGFSLLYSWQGVWPVFLSFKGWLCQVERGSENDCMVKMLTSITVVFPQTWCIFYRPGRSLFACFHRQTVTVLKFWKAKTGWVCKASQPRSPGKLPLSSDVRMWTTSLSRASLEGNN